MKNYSFIDCGCGTGNAIRYFFENGYFGRYLGVELDEDAYESAKNLFVELPQNEKVSRYILKTQTSYYLYETIVHSIFIKRNENMKLN